MSDQTTHAMSALGVPERTSSSDTEVEHTKPRRKRNKPSGAQTRAKKLNKLMLSDDEDPTWTYLRDRLRQLRAEVGPSVAAKILAKEIGPITEADPWDFSGTRPPYASRAAIIEHLERQIDVELQLTTAYEFWASAFERALAQSNPLSMSDKDAGLLLFIVHRIGVAIDHAGERNIGNHRTIPQMLRAIRDRSEHKALYNAILNLLK